MKKILVLLAALLCICCIAAAETETEKDPELFDLWDAGGESMAWISTAIPVADGALITAASNLAGRGTDLVVTDGKIAWEVKAVCTDSTGVLSIIFFDPEGTPTKHGNWGLLPFGKSVPASGCMVRSGDELASRLNQRVLSSGETDWNGNRCLLLTLTGRPEIGSAVLTQDGELAGITVAYYAEGENRVLAVNGAEIIRSVNEAVRAVRNLPNWGNPEEGFEVTADRNRVTIDWSGMTLPEKENGEEFYLVVLDAGNDYLSYYPAETDERKLSLILAPGRIYLTGILKSKGAPDTYPEHFTVIAVPNSGRLTEYAFESKVCAIAEAPAGGLYGDSKPVPVTEVTEDLLRSGRAYFYSHSVYEVSETIGGKSLLVTLTAPDGSNYMYISEWIYGPEYMEEDIWYVPLTASGLTQELDTNGYPKGQYRMAFYVEGELADSFVFTLK